MTKILDDLEVWIYDICHLKDDYFLSNIALLDSCYKVECFP